MPFTNPQSHNCKAGSSKHPQSTSLGKKRKHQLLSDVFDGSHIEDTEDKGKKTTKKFNPNGEICTRALPTESSKRLQPASPAEKHRQRLLSNVSDGKDTQDERVRRKMKKTKKMKKMKAEQKCDSSQSSKEPYHGIRNVVKSESSRHPLSTSSAKAPQDRPLPDIYSDDPDRHAAQDKKVLETLIYHQYPLDPVSPMPVGLLIPVIIEVVLLAKQEDPHIPLRSEFSDVRTAVKDEEFRKVIETCYRSGFYKDLRNHPIMRKVKVRFLDDY